MTIAAALVLAIFVVGVLPTTGALPTSQREPLQTTRVDGVTASLMSFDAEPSRTTAEICLELPTNEDWQPQAILATDDGNVPPELVELLNSKNPETFSGTFRCYRFVFEAQADLEAEDNLVIERIQTAFPMRIDDAKCAEANERARSAQPDIAFTCIIGDHGGSIELVSRPEGMTEEDALLLAYDSFVQTLEGPWTFTLN